MAGSPSAAHVRLAAAGGGVEAGGIPKGGAPLALTLLVAPVGAGLRALASGAEAEGLPWAPLAGARVAAADAAGAADAARPPGAPPPPEGAAPPPPLFAPRAEAGAAVAELPLAAAPAASLYAAYDLWAATRWSAHYAPAALRAATGGAASAGAPQTLALTQQRLAIAHPRLAHLAEHVLRLDPCAMARVALPALGTPGTRPARAVDEPALAAALATQLAAESGRGEAGPASPKDALVAEAFVAAALNAAERFPQRVEVVYY
jgi:hypothetical protein